MKGGFGGGGWGLAGIGAAFVAARVVLSTVEAMNNFQSGWGGGGGSGSGGGGGGSSSSSNRPSSSNARQTSTNTPPDTSESSQPPQPPQGNRNPGSGHKVQQNTNPELEDFLAIFGVSNLNDILINGKYLFREITQPGNKSRRDTLKSLLKKLKKNGVFQEVIRMVAEEIMVLMEPGEITFINFVNLCEFAARYISERAARLNEVRQDRAGGGQSSERYEQRQETAITQVEQEIRDSGFRDLTTEELMRPGGYYGAVTIIRRLKTEIQLFQNRTPNFHNELAAWTHYFKHRVVPGTGEVLTVTAYMELIYSNMDRIRTLPQYSELTANPPTRQRLAYDIVIRRFGMRRFRIILKIQDKKLVVASGHVLDDPIKDDQDGEEYIDADQGNPKNTKVQRN